MRGIELISDNLGEAATISVDLTVYGKAALFKAAYWFTEHAFLYLAPGDNKNVVLVEVRPKNSGDAAALARQFCNALIDQQTRQYVLQETASTRDALLRKAFGEGRHHLDPATLSSASSDKTKT